MCLCEGEVLWQGWNITGRRGVYLGEGIFPARGGVISRLASSQPEGGYLGASMSLVEASISLVWEEFGTFLVGDVICDLWSC